MLGTIRTARFESLLSDSGAQVLLSAMVFAVVLCGVYAYNTLVSNN